MGWFGFSGLLSARGVGISASLITAGMAAGGPWADIVVSYAPGAGVSAGYDDPSRALGAPTRVTGESFGFPGVTTPYAGAFEPDEVVTIGRGGSLVLGFHDAVRDDAGNPFGIDLLVFGNQFLISDSDNRATAVFDEGGTIELSADGVSWTLLTGLSPEGGLPTLGYADVTDPFQSTPGSVLTDFTRPVDPSFNPIGKTFAEIVAAYDGSGGGLGIDIGAWGLSEVRYIRFSNTVDGAGTPEIDAVARVVPAPGVLALAGLAGLGWRRRRR